jgi:hypothetical protein
VYLILDEFILGGEFEETSKKVRPGSKQQLATSVASLFSQECFTAAVSNHAMENMHAVCTA